ncbi:glucose PTS transporter subunit IIA [Spiroplasma endosymbiont of Anurida maritima]|uniref:glucose PTS transporter subunit IIA n=1 Tax=Spiroplasma endosymbiont of Anurida maritima TaxID=2967972 RepID=UPI0036D41431
MKSLKVYAPASGVVKNLKELNDGVFSKGMLGEGFYIEPETNIFNSPFEKAKLKMIFPTKHAYYVESEDGLNMLIHIGLDTVSLEGKPFNPLAKIEDELSLNSSFVDVNLEEIQKNKLRKSTPMVIEGKNYKNLKFNFTKENQWFKQGELIGEFTWEEKSVVQKQSSELEIEDIIFQKSNHEIIAEEIYKNVGSNSNYSQVYNCMTRLRFDVKSKDKVDVEKIKKIEMVKGINWAGNQLQIIIGGEVYKVKDALVNYVETLNSKNIKKPVKTRIPFRKRFMSAIGGIMLPTLPVLLAAGMLMGIKSILILIGLMQDVVLAFPGEDQTLLKEANVFSAVFYIIAEVSLKFLGIFIGYNTAKYLGGNLILQLFVSLAIANPIAGEGAKWFLFEVGGLDVNSQVYTSSILPHIASAFMLFHFEKWVKTWMPTAVDVIFRPLVVVAVVTLGTFFLVGPILFLLEQGVSIVISTLGKIPYGVGVGIYALSWQPLVLTGMHIAVAMPISMSVVQGIPNPLAAGVAIGVFGQIGALIGVAIRTKNAKTRQTAFGSLPAGLVGITEPIIFGINLPKIRPFIAGMIGAGIAGLFSGFVGVETRIPGGMGVFSILAYIAGPVFNEEVNGVVVNSISSPFTGEPLSLVMNALLYCVTILIAIGVGLGVNLLIYKERPSEKNQILKTNKILLKNFAKANNITKKEAQNLLNKNFIKLSDHLTKENLLKINSIEKEILSIINLQTKMNTILIKEENKKQNIKKALVKEMAKDQNKQNSENLLKLKNKYNEIIKNTKVTDLKHAIEQKKLKNETNMNWLKDYQNNFMLDVKDLFAIINNELVKKEEVNKLKNNYENGIHSLDINYKYYDKKENTFSKKRFNLELNPSKKGIKNEKLI